MASPDVDRELANLRKMGIVRPDSGLQADANAQAAAQAAQDMAPQRPQAPPGPPTDLGRASTGLHGIARDLGQAGAAATKWALPITDPVARGKMLTSAAQVFDPAAGNVIPPAGTVRQPVAQSFGDETPEVLAAKAQQAGSDAQTAAQAAPAGPTYVAPHFDDRNVPIRPETQGRMLDIYDAREEAAAQKARAEMAQDTIQANAMQAEAARAQRSMAGRMAEEDQRRTMMRQQQQKLDQLTAAAQAGKIDPDQVWKSKGTAGQIAASIGIALGAGLQAKNGGSNVALDIVNSEIARNIDAQKANAQLTQQGVENQAGLLAHYREMFGDERLAEMAFENTARDVAIQQVKAEAAKYQSPITAANAADFIAQLEQQKLKTRSEFDQMAFVKGHLVGGGLGTPKNLNQDRLVRTPDGKFLVARSDKEAQDLRQAGAILPVIQRNFHRAIEIRNDPTWWFNPALLQELHSLQTESEPLISKMGDNSVLRDQEREDMRSNLTAFASKVPGTSKNLAGSVKRFEGRYNFALESQAAPLAETGYQTDANGALVPVAGYTGEDRLPKNRAMPSSFAADGHRPEASGEEKHAPVMGPSSGGQRGGSRGGGGGGGGASAGTKTTKKTASAPMNLTMPDFRTGKR